MKPQKSVVKPVLLLFLVVVLSAFTVVFGAAPLSALREKYGRGVLLLSGLALVALMLGLKAYPLAAVICFLVVLVGVFKELEGHLPTVFWSGLTAIGITIGAGVVAVGAWLKQSGLSIRPMVTEVAEALLLRLKTVSPEIGLTANDLLVILPSLLVMTMVVSLVVSLVWGPRLAAWASGTTQGLELDKKELLNFKLPSVFIWIMLVSILGTFLKLDSKAVQVVAENLFNVLVLLYFFQGFAIAQVFFVKAKFSPMWQFFWNVLFLLQLFPIVSLVGFSDYWLEFRSRMARSGQKSQRPEFDLKEK